MQNKKVTKSYIFDESEKRIEFLEKEIEKARKIIENLPQGKLHVAPGHNSHNFRYYLISEGKGEQYLDKSKNELKKQLAYRRYNEELIKQANKEVLALKSALKKYKVDSLNQAYLNVSKGVRLLITPIFVDDDTFVGKWKDIPYERLGFDQNDKTQYYSELGERMRSRIEVLIANALYYHGIPYKYECPVTRVNGEKLYPDFTILDVKRRRLVYWEHLGKMGDLSYVSKNLWKLDEYRKIGIYLGINLFLTFESEISPIATGDVQRVIDYIQE